LIYDGFDSHLDPAVVNFCWNHRIIPYCLPAHTSHISQPLDVGVFSSLQNYYSEEVNKLQGRAITNDNFPNLLSRARRRAFTEKNIKAGFRASGIVPLNPNVILDKLHRPDTPPTVAEFTIPHSSETPRNATPPRSGTPAEVQAHEDAVWTCETPTTPASISALNQEAFKTILSTSPHSTKQHTIFKKQQNVIRNLWAELQMAKAGEKHLREGEKTNELKQDRRKLNSGSAVIVERGSALIAEKLAKDQLEGQSQEPTRKKTCLERTQPSPTSYNNLESPVYTQYVMKF
jgi:hypothetical protein